MKKKMNKREDDEQLDYMSGDDEKDSYNPHHIIESSLFYQHCEDNRPKCHHNDRQNSNSINLLNNYCTWCEMLEHEKQKACVKLIADKHLPPKLIMSQDMIISPKHEDVPFKENIKGIQDAEKQEQYLNKNNSLCNDCKIPNFNIDLSNKHLLEDPRFKANFPLHVDNSTQMTPKRSNFKKENTDDLPPEIKSNALLELDEASLTMFSKLFKDYLKFNGDHVVEEKKKCCCNCKCSKTKTLKKRSKSERKNDKISVLEPKGDVHWQNMDTVNYGKNELNFNQLKLNAKDKSGSKSHCDSGDCIEVPNELDECRQVIVALDQVCNQYKQIVANCYKKINNLQNKDAATKKGKEDCKTTSNHTVHNLECTPQDVPSSQEANPIEFYQNLMKQNFDQYELLKILNSGLLQATPATSNQPVPGFSQNNFNQTKVIEKEAPEQNDHDARLYRGNAPSRHKKSLIEEFQDYIKRQNLNMNDNNLWAPNRSSCETVDQPQMVTKETNNLGDYAKSKDNNQSRGPYNNFSKMAWPFYDC